MPHGHTSPIAAGHRNRPTSGTRQARIRKATGLKPSDVTAALTAATLSPDTHATIDALDHQLGLDQLAVLAEFEDDPHATPLPG